MMIEAILDHPLLCIDFFILGFIVCGLWVLYRLRWRRR